jgi:hypothetical protein
MTRRVWDVFVFSLLGGSRFWAESGRLRKVIIGLNNNGLGATWQTNLSFHSRSFVLTSEPTSRAEVAVIKGTEAAERTLNDFDGCQTEESRRAGWRYFLEKTDLRPGMDPEKATKLRQVRFDLQES